MRRLRVAGALLATCFVAAAAGISVHAARQVRDNGAVLSMPRGTSVISGVVLFDDASNKPLRRVSVTLASGNLQVPQTTVTDEAGVFTFAALPAGNYTLVAMRPGYVTSFYGAKKPGRGTGVPIAVLDGQRMTDVRMRMLRGGVITGMIRREDGSPAQGVDVQVLSLKNVNGPRKPTQILDNLAALQGVATDDRGRYRVFGLAPGEYVVQSLVRSNPFGSAIAGRQVTREEIQWAQQASTSALSPAPGQASSPLLAAPPLGQTVDYSPVYYPGVVQVADAAVVAIGPGEEHDGVDFATRLVPTAKISGAVTDLDGRPMAGSQITLRQIDGDSTDVVGALLGGGGARTATEGTFAVHGVRPGRYRVMARGGAPFNPTRFPAPAGPPVAGGPPTPPPPPPPPPGLNLSLGGLLGGNPGQTSWALQDVTVEGRDIPGVMLQLRPGMTISGKFAFESSSLQPPTDLSRARITMATAPTGSSMMEMATAMLGSAMGTTSADGSFVINGVIPGSYRFNVLLPGMRLNPAAKGTGWMLKSIAADGRDVSDLPLEVRPNENITGLVVTMTDAPAELSGAVLDRAGRAAPGFPIIVFSTNRAFWTVGSRRVQQIRPSSDGKFLIAGLPAGEYFVCAVTDLDPSDLYDPTFLEQLAPSAFRITLADGEKKTQDLRLAGGGLL